MRFLLKILFAPILAVLAVVTWFFVFVVGLSSGILCIPAAITVALSFATFENVCYLIQNGADRFSFIFFRGFGTGAMHVLCGLIVGGGKAIRFPIITEAITEYSLLESCFLAALKFF